jgi:hypothetical protein
MDVLLQNQQVMVQIATATIATATATQSVPTEPHRPSISWKNNPEFAILVLEQAYAVKIHLKGNKETHWREATIILNSSKFLNYRPVESPSYKKVYTTKMKEVEIKYALKSPGFNVSSLPEVANQSILFTQFETFLITNKCKFRLYIRVYPFNRLPH